VAAVSSKMDWRSSHLAEFDIEDEQCAAQDIINPDYEELYVKTELQELDDCVSDGGDIEEQTVIWQTGVGKKHKCRKCDYCATKKGNLKAHQKAVHEGFKYICKICHKQFSAKSNLKKHFNSVHEENDCEERKYPCNLCVYQAKRKSHLQRHFEIKHTDRSLLTQLKCSDCDYTTIHKGHLKIHKESIHYGVKYTCRLCKKQLSCKKTLTNHMRLMHKQEQGIEERKLLSSPDHGCRDNEYRTSLMKSLDTRKDPEHMQLRHLCDQYSHQFTEQLEEERQSQSLNYESLSEISTPPLLNALHQHLILISKSENEDTINKVNSTNRRKQKNPSRISDHPETSDHMLINASTLAECRMSELERLADIESSKQDRSKEDLEHILSSFQQSHHTGERNPSDLPEVLYSSPNQHLTNNNSTEESLESKDLHSANVGNRNRKKDEWHQCQHCDYKTKRKSHFKRHYQLKHIENWKAQSSKEIKCKECDYTTISPSHLKIHQESVHDGVKHMCNICHKMFSAKSTLNKHIKVAHEGKKFPCSLCDYQSTRNTYLKSHFLTFHSGHEFNPVGQEAQMGKDEC